MKKNLLFTMMCVLGLFGTLRAQTTVTIDGDGTNNSSQYGNYGGPFDVYSTATTSSQSIYTNAEIGRGEGTIEKIAFKVDVADYSANSNRSITVWLKNYTETNFGKNTKNTLVQMTDEYKVYTGTYDISTSGWIEIDIADFNYDGTNLLVSVCDNTRAKGSGDTKFNVYESRVLDADANYWYKTLYKSGASPDGTTNFAGVNYTASIQFTFASNSGGSEELADYRLESVKGANAWNDIRYAYEDGSDKVVKIFKGDVANFDQGWSVEASLLKYDENGVVTGYTQGYVYSYDDTEVDATSEYSEVAYNYTDGNLTSYAKTTYYTWKDPESTEYTFSYNEDNLIDTMYFGTAIIAYEYEEGKLVTETRSYYDQWAATPGYVTEYIKEYTYDANGNCTIVTQYSTYSGEKVAQNATEYFYDLTISAEDVCAFTYPHEVLPAHANVITKTLSYNFQEDWQTGETYKSDFSVSVYSYNPAIVAAPLAPVDLKATALSDTKVSLTWEAIESAESFSVYYENGTLALDGITDTYCTIEGLTADTEYSFVVKGVNGTEESDASNVATVTTMKLVNIVPSEIAFGEVRLGSDYWSENKTAIDVTIEPLGKTITNIATDNNFFRLPANIDLTSENVAFTVDYKKNAEAGEYTGSLVVTLDSGATVSIPLSATAYEPVESDVFELAKEVVFTEGVYTDTPDMTVLYDDYNLPNEEQDSIMLDAVYAVTLAKDSELEVAVTGKNAIYAVYEAFGEDEGPTAENAYYGDDRVLSTAFTYDFADASLADFTIVDNDDNKDYTWKIEDGALVSYSYIWDYDNYTYLVSQADERVITNNAYAITANSVLTLDINVNGQGGEYGELVIVEVTKDGETFTEIGVVCDDENLYSYDFMSKRVEIGARFAELGLEYGDYKVSLRHNKSCGNFISVDNLSLTERKTLYPAGTYYVVAAATADLAVEIRATEFVAPTPEVPVAKAYRLESVENFSSTVYTYDEVYTNRVVAIDEDGSVTELSYNAEGQLVSAISTIEDVDENGNPTEVVLSNIGYVYNAEGLMTAFTETAQGMAGEMTITTNLEYDTEGRLEIVDMPDYEVRYTYVYNAEGLVSERIESYPDYENEGNWIASSKEIYTYEEGKLVQKEYQTEDYENGGLITIEKIVYTYDANGNCVSEEVYSCEGEEPSLFQTYKYYYDATVLNEDVYKFTYPHFAILEPVAPSYVNALVKEMSFYSYYNEEIDAVENHTYILTVYNYSPAIETVPVAPINLTAEVVEGDVELSWEVFADAETFTVYQGEEVVAENVEAGEYTVTGLAAGEYCFTVKAVNAKGASEASNAACVTIDEEPIVPEPTVPAAPVLAADSVKVTTVVLTWNVVEGATSYNVYQGADSIANVTDTTYTVEGLTAETEYTFVVKAVNEVGESEASNEVSVKTLAGEGIAENAAAFNVYPNPVNDKLFIETEANVVEVVVYDMFGRKLSAVSGQQSVVDVTELNSGVYFVKVVTDNGEAVQRFVKK